MDTYYSRLNESYHLNSLLLFLAAFSGCIDTICYLLFHVFTANMTGNTVVLGLAIGNGKLTPFSSAATSLVFFMAGVILGTIVIGSTPIHHLKLRKGLFVEFLFILLFIVLIAFPNSNTILFYVGIALAAIAMGMQSTLVSRLGIQGVVTTYITGTLTSILYEWTSKRNATPAAPAMDANENPASEYPLALQAKVFGIFLVSAALTALINHYIKGMLPYFPLLIMIGIYISSRSRNKN